jgi:hypothetical protein
MFSAATRWESGGRSLFEKIEKSLDEDLESLDEDLESLDGYHKSLIGFPKCFDQCHKSFDRREKVGACSIKCV